jgi:hypothetical protein
MAWAKNGTPDTLTGTSSTVTIADQTSTKFNKFLFHGLNSGSITGDLRLGNGGIDSGSNYAHSQSQNGGARGTGTGVSYVLGAGGGGTDAEERFLVGYIVNISSEEKLVIFHGSFHNAAGASNAPNRGENRGKWANTSAQFDNIQFNDAGGAGGNFAADSNLSAIGSD